MERDGFTRVLIAAASEETARTLCGVIPDEFRTVGCVRSIRKAKQLVLQEKADILILCSPLPDETGIRDVMELGESGTAGILLLVPQDSYAQAGCTAGKAGIFVLARPTGRQSIVQALRMVHTMKQQTDRLVRENRMLRKKLEDLRLVTRAKCLLIGKERMTEGEAHHYLEKLAMDSCITKREAATDIIRRMDAVS